MRESVCERERLSGGVLQTNWCNWPMKDLRSPLGTKTLRMPTEQGNRIRHLSLFSLLFTLSSFIYFVFNFFCFFPTRYLQSILNYDCSGANPIKEMLLVINYLTVHFLNQVGN